MGTNLLVTFCLVSTIALVGGLSIPRLIIPAYIYPGPDDPNWDAIYKTPTTAEKYIIMNVQSGPGPQWVIQYAWAIQNLTRLGFIPLGYVDTGYGNTAFDTVYNDIELWESWYNVTSIFFDDASSSPDKLSYYQQIYDYVKAKSSSNIVITNQGTDPQDEGYADVADIVCNCEVDYTAYLTYVHKPWIYNHPPSKFYQIVYNVPEADLSNAFSIANATNGGYVYFLDTDSYHVIPSYWSLEVSLARTFLKRFFSFNQLVASESSTTGSITSTTTGTSGSTAVSINIVVVTAIYLAVLAL